jgi:hypothetical protein
MGPIRKRKYLVFMLWIFLPAFAYAHDFAGQYYTPTIFGIVSGPAAPLPWFEEYSADSRFLLPIETKFLALRFGAFALSLNAIVSVYVEDRAFISLNLSTGASLYLNRRETSPMGGWYVTLYPLYELPIATLGQSPLWDWISAPDLGFSADVFGPLYVSFFSRFCMGWHDAKVAFFPDAGIAVGLYFR